MSLLKMLSLKLSIIVPFSFWWFNDSLFNFTNMANNWDNFIKKKYGTKTYNFVTILLEQDAPNLNLNEFYAREPFQCESSTGKF